MYIKSQSKVHQLLYLTSRFFRKQFKIKSLAHLKVKKLSMAKLSVKHKVIKLKLLPNLNYH